MLEFTEFQQNAKNMPGKFMRCYSAYQGCLSFFSALMPTTSQLHDIYTISLLASSLNDENDRSLLIYLNSITGPSNMSLKDFNEFKSKILAGIYLLMWSHYNSLVTSYLNRSLIQMFQADLQVNSIESMDRVLFDESLEALSQYCSFIYENRDEKAYSDLNGRLGTTIQVDIHSLRFPTIDNGNTWGCVCTGFLRTLGI